MSNRPKMFIHIGYPKTATTFIQKQLFAELHNRRSINYFGMYPPSELGLKGVEFLEDLTHRIIYEPDERRASAAILDLRTQLQALLLLFPSPAIYVLSNEHMTSSGPSSGQRGKTANPHATARRVRELLPNWDVKIWMTIRNQITLSHSFLAQMRSKPFHRNPALFQDVDAYVGHITASNGGLAEMFDFDSVAESFSAVFGKDNFHLALYEDLDADPDSFVTSMTRALGVARPNGCYASRKRDNVKVRDADGYVVPGLSLSKVARRAVRRARPLRSFLMQPGLRPWTRQAAEALSKVSLPGHRIRNYTPEEVDKISRRFAPSNCRLAERFGLELERLVRYGYPVGPSSRL